MRKGKGEGVTEADMDSVVHAHNCECLQATFLMLALALVSGGIDVLASRRPVKARLWHLHNRSSSCRTISKVVIATDIHDSF